MTKVQLLQQKCSALFPSLWGNEYTDLYSSLLIPFSCLFCKISVGPDSLPAYALETVTMFAGIKGYEIYFMSSTQSPHWKALKPYYGKLGIQIKQNS